MLQKGPRLICSDLNVIRSRVVWLETDVNCCKETEWNGALISCGRETKR